jgi:Trk K+ transport system NAD-binding subunit
MNKREIERIVNEKDWTARIANAIVYNDRDLLVALSKDKVSQVRLIVASSDLTPIKTLIELSNDDDIDVRTVAKEKIEKSSKNHLTK